MTANAREGWHSVAKEKKERGRASSTDCDQEDFRSDCVHVQLTRKEESTIFSPVCLTYRNLRDLQLCLRSGTEADLRTTPTQTQEKTEEEEEEARNNALSPSP